MRRGLTVVLAVLTSVLLAACGGGAAPDGGGGDGGAALAVTGTDGLAFEPAELTAPPDEITVELTAEPSVRHTFVVEDADGDTTVVEAAAGETATGTVSLEAGSYTFYCDVPGHREAGMEGTLEVQG